MTANVKTNFEYHVPQNVDETLSLLAQFGSDSRLIAGGTDLIPKIKSGILPFAHLVSLKSVKELTELSFDVKKGLVIGANTKLIDVERDETVQRLYPALAAGIHSMANTQVRNRGTVVGNVCNALPSADTVPALLVYGTLVKIRSAAGERTVPIEEFFTGVCRTVLQPDEMVTAFVLPTPDEKAFSIYYKYTVRKALELAMIGVALNIVLDDEDIVKDAKLALGAVAATPKRAWQAEQFVIGKKLTDDVILEAAEIASQQDCTPISDIRASADYRREMVRVHVRDALRKAVESK